MDIVPKPRLLMLGGILCQAEKLVKSLRLAIFDHVIIWLMFPETDKLPLTYF
jgi:hypothetical protein